MLNYSQFLHEILRQQFIKQKTNNNKKNESIYRGGSGDKKPVEWSAKFPSISH